MLNIGFFSQALTAKIQESIPMDDEKSEIVEYGLYMSISESVKLIATLCLAALLNVLPLAITGVLTFGFLRNFLGGVHAKTHWGCFFCYSCILFGSAYLSMAADLRVAGFVIFPVAFITAWLYAPADIENKPVVSKRQTKHLRIGGFALLTVVCVAIFLIPVPFANMMMLVTFFVSVLMWPVTYSLSGNRHGREEAN